MLKYLIIFIISVLLLSQKTIAQPSVEVITEIGNTQVSDGTYFNASVFAAYKINTFHFEAGAQKSSLYSAAINDISASISKDFKWKEYKPTIETFFLYSNFSTYLYETNWGLKIILPLNKHEIILGNSFKTYSFNKNMPDYEENINEFWNIIYSYTYFLKAPENNWNVSASLTNFDYFLVNQETNPFVKVKGEFQLNQSLNIYTECWYKTAGAFNLNVNYFGYLIRCGLVWQIQ